MPQQPGEVTLCTLFADIHYYFSHPAVKPLHHRFDKRSYVYLYHDALNRRGRLEIANYAGTPDQDAFMGYLSSALIDYSYKHPTLFTITVDGARPAPSPHHSAPPDVSQWHLPATDPHNMGRYMYKLHTIDIYLWTADDGSLFLDSLKRVVAETQLRIYDVPPTEHRDSMSPVVQQLERVAVSDPQRTDSISTTHTSHSQPTNISRGTPVSPPGPAPAETAPQHAPIAAYNPAAPPAPEPIAHREKTPPPSDAASGTGLKAATQHEAGEAQFSGPPQQAYGQQPYFSGPPAQQPQPGLQRSNTTPYQTIPSYPQPSPYASSFAAPIQAPQDPNAQFMPNQLQRQATMPTAFGPYGPQQQQQQHPTFPSAVPSAAAPPPYQASIPQQEPPQQQQYAYGNHDQRNIHHSIHNQLYFPDGEGHGHEPAKAGPGQASAVGRLEQKASIFEKGINRLLKKVDSGI